jgi:hypothetical protein
MGSHNCAGTRITTTGVKHDRAMAEQTLIVGYSGWPEAPTRRPQFSTFDIRHAGPGFWCISSPFKAAVPLVGILTDFAGPC